MTDPKVKVSVSTPVDAVTQIAGAIRELAMAIGLWIKGADIRRMRAAIEAAEQYILISESGLYEGVKLTDAKKAQHLKHFKTRFFRTNN
jgi:hypothetical protein